MSEAVLLRLVIQADRLRWLRLEGLGSRPLPRRPPGHAPGLATRRRVPWPTAAATMAPVAC